MFRRSHPASRLSNTELKKLEHLFEMVDSCTVDVQGRLGRDTSRKLADAINDYPNATMVYEVMRRIRKCFKSGNPQVVLRALDLTDTLMQSCGAHARREVGSEKFLKLMGKLCKITKTRLDPSWQTVAERAQDLIEDWAETSEQTVGPGNRFTQAYLNLRRDGVQFRGASGRTGRGLGGARSSITGMADYAGGGGRQFRSGRRGESRLQGRGMLQPGDQGYDEEAELAAAIASSLDPADPRGARGGIGLAASAEDGELLSMVPPTIEALMDIMEGSRDLTELLDNEVAPDVVDQTRGLVEQVIKQVEQLEAGDSPDEKDMDRYLKAHDDLQTVLRLYEGVLDGKTTLPLRRSGPVGGDAVAAAGGQTETDLDEAFGGVRARAGSGDDDSLVAGDDGRKGASSRRTTGSGDGAGSGRGSPAKGNLLDLEENAPLAVGGSGEGMMVYGGGGFHANNSSNNVGEVFGSGTTSNVPSETGAVCGSYNFGSNNDGGTNFGGHTHLTSGSGDSGGGFDPFASFSPASGAPAPNLQAPGEPAPKPVAVSSFSRFGENQSSAASPNVPRGTPGQQSPSDFGTWISSVRGANANGDAFGTPANGPGGGMGGGRQMRFQSSESTSFHSSNGGRGASPTLGPIAEMSPGFGGSGGGGNPFESPAPAAVGGGEGGGGSGFAQHNWPGTAEHGAGATARSSDPGHPFSLGPATAFGGPRGPIDGGAARAVFYQPQQAPTTFAAIPGSQSTTSSSSFPMFSPSAGPQQAPPPQPAQSQQLQHHEQQHQWWQHPQQQETPQRQPQPQQQDAADPFTGAILGSGATGASTFGSGVDNDPFPQAQPQFQTQAPYSSSVTPFGGGGGGGVGSGSFDSDSRGHWLRNSTDSTSSLVQGPTFASGGSGRSSVGGLGAVPPEQTSAGGNVLSQALVVAGGVGIGGGGPFGPAPAPRKVNPFDDPEPAAPPVYGTPHQGPQQPPQQQQHWPQPQNLPQPPSQQAPQFQQHGGGGGNGQGNQDQGQGQGHFGFEPQRGFQQQPQQLQQHQQQPQQPQQQNFFV